MLVIVTYPFTVMVFFKKISLKDCFQHINKVFKAGAQEATNRCNTLLQQIALCVQSSDKLYALMNKPGSRIAVISVIKF